MSKILTIPELRNMQEADLLREINKQFRVIAKLSHAVRGGVEKGSHLLRKEKAQLARMQTVLSELRASKAPTTIAAPVV
jgi:ribosomal protein L29